MNTICRPRCRQRRGWQDRGALPAFADAQFPCTTAGFVRQVRCQGAGDLGRTRCRAQKILDGEKKSGHERCRHHRRCDRGRSAPVSSRTGVRQQEFNDAAGRDDARQGCCPEGLEMWLSLVDRGVMQKNIGEVRPADMVNAFRLRQSGGDGQLGLRGTNCNPGRPTVKGTGRRTAAAGNGGRQVGHLHRRLAMGGEARSRKTRQHRRSWCAT